MLVWSVRVGAGQQVGGLAALRVMEGMVVGGALAGGAGRGSAGWDQEASAQGVGW